MAPQKSSLTNILQGQHITALQTRREIKKPQGQEDIWRSIKKFRKTKNDC